MNKVWMRICYKRGIKKEGNELYEFHKACDCDKCRFNFEYKISVPHAATATTDDISKIDEVKKFLESWNCSIEDGSSKVVSYGNNKIVYFDFRNK